MDNEAYAEYINQEVAALNGLHLYRKQRGRFRTGCPNCGNFCERRGGTLECVDCVYCGTNTPDEYNMLKSN